ncbi:calcipressin [Physcia stellaris]|nr:calcipressin [Physcia stellaris]
MAFDWDESLKAHQQVYQQGGGHKQPNQTKFSTELIASAAAFEGMKRLEDKLRKEDAEDHLAAFAIDEVDKLAEKRCMNDCDRQFAKGDAETKARELYSSHQYQSNSYEWYDPNTSE